MSENSNKPSFELTFGLHNIMLSIHELVAEVCTSPDEYEKFDRLFSLERLYRRAIEEGHETFDWQRIHEAGFLSRHDYVMFAKELNGLTEEMWWKSQGYDGIPGKKK